MNERLWRLAEIGQGVWMDSLSRDDIENGNLGEIIEVIQSKSRQIVRQG